MAGLSWRSDGAAVVSRIWLQADDDAILGALLEADRAAIDCPFGWPDPFVEFLAEHQVGHVSVRSGEAGLAWRRRLSRRETDLACEQSGVRPLSVSADRIAAVAMRGAGILSELAARGCPVARDGSGALLETYPAAALRAWGLPYQSYKGRGKRAALNALVDALCESVPLLHLGVAADHIRLSDDVFDAVVCALVARAAALGQVTGPPPGSRERAEREGWMCLPTGHLRDLFG